MTRATVYGRDLDGDGWPSVSVVMPVRDEATHLARAVASVLAQDYPVPFEACLAVAPSGDATAEVAAALAAGDPRVTVTANPAGVTPAGLNAAVAATSGEVIVRVDGHAELAPGYIRRAVATMVRTGAVNVGGRQVPAPETPFEEAVAAATTSWLGTGGAEYRVGGAEGPVDTVYLGVFDRAAGDAVGWFDASLIRNQDYELNIRLRAAGGTVWFDPELAVAYRPRGSWRALARQYFEDGWWKAEVLRTHPGSWRARQVVPLANLVAQLAALAALGRWRAAALVPGGYLAALAWGAGRQRRRGAWRTVLVAVTMHQAWAVGMLRGLVASPRR